MEMTFNSMPTAYYADRNISFLSKLVLERIWSLSKQGQREVFFNRQVYADFFGANPSSLSKCFKELIDNGYLHEVKNKNPFDRTKKFYVIDKQSTVEKSNNENVEKSNSEITLDSQQKQYSECCKKQQSKSNFCNNLHQTDQYSKEKNRSESSEQHSLSFDFNSLFYAMNEIKNEFTDHIFTDAEIRENAQSYLDKSQEYKFYKGKVTRNKLKLWLKNSIDHNQKEISAQHTPITLAGLQDNKAVNDFEQLKKQILEQENQNLKKDDPIEADFEIIDEHDQNKNAPA